MSRWLTCGRSNACFLCGAILFSTTCYARQTAFSLIQNKFLRYTVPHQIPLASVREAQLLRSQSNVGRTSCQVISFLSMSNDFSLFSAYQILTQHSRPCLIFPSSVTPFRFPQAPCLVLPRPLTTL